jgi:hypothetical protein
MCILGDVNFEIEFDKDLHIVSYNADLHFEEYLGPG